MPTHEKSSVALILLAAGESRRMGTQKQLLPVQGKPMVRLIAERARDVSTGPLIIVTGANGPDVAQAVAGLEAHCTFNAEWAEGMGASLRHGMRTLAQIAPDSPAVLILLADQPGVSTRHLAALLDTHRAHPERIIATEHNGVAQPPVLFPQPWFARLATLQGDRGARAILREAANEIHLVHADSIDDVDTPEDYKNFIDGAAG